MSRKEDFIRFGKRTALIAFGFGLGTLGVSGVTDAVKDVKEDEKTQAAADLQAVYSALLVSAGFVSLGSGIIYKNPRLQMLLSRKEKNVEDQSHSQDDSGN